MRISLATYVRVVIMSGVLALCLGASPAFAQTDLELFDQLIQAPIQGGGDASVPLPTPRPEIDGGAGTEFEVQTEGDPRNCSIVILTPEGPEIITVARNPFGDCPDQFQTADGGLQSTIGGQIPDVIKDLLRGAGSSLLNRLRGGFGNNQDIPNYDDYYGEDYGSGFDVTDGYQYGGFDFPSYFNDGANGGGFIFTGGTSSTGGGTGGVGSTGGTGSTGGGSSGEGSGSGTSSGNGTRDDVVTGSQSLGDRICSSRPWAEGVLGAILPDVVFDGLCNRLGFETQRPNTGGTGSFTGADDLRGISCSPSIVQPGNSATLRFSCGNASLAAVAGFTLSDAAAREKTVTPDADAVYGIRCSDGFEDFCAVEVAPPTADVWADPQSVRLGARTTIWWESTGVDTCRVSGPSFSENTLQGSSATVPIGNATTFTITCSAPDGSIVSDRTTVDIAL